LENILIDEKGEPKLIDWGFCEILAKDSLNRRSCEMIGSADYACPEILERLPYSPEMADVFSLGVILVSYSLKMLII
jgi:serine/threonine protein kinase